MSSSSRESFHDVKVNPETVAPTNSSHVPKAGGDHPEEFHVPTQAGVNKVKDARRVWGKTSLILFFLGVAAVSYTYSLDGSTTYYYGSFAASSFSEHSDTGAIATAQAIVLAVAKPVAAKISDVFGRAEAFSITVFLYVLGYIICAACTNFNSYAAGVLIAYMGYAAIQILIQIIIADVTNMRWRGFVSGMTSIWFFINFAVASNIAAAIVKRSTWHWGYGMFCIIIPFGTAPIIGVLFWAQRRAKQLGVQATNYDYKNKADVVVLKDERPLSQRAVSHFKDMDIIGLILFSFGFSLFLLPITLVNSNHLTWQSGKIIAMIVVGGVTLFGFVFWEAKFAPTPLFPLRFFKSKTIVACALIGFFDFVSFYLQYTYQYSFIYVVKSDSWSLVNQNYFAYTQTLSLTFFGIMAGVFMIFFRRTKWLLFVGLLIRLLGVGIMIYTKGAHGSTAGLVFGQLLQGIGGGFASASTQVLAQASVPHQDVATVTALVLLLAEIGNAVGSAMATGIWKQWMPGQLNTHLAGLANSTEIAAIFGSITVAASYPKDSAIYQGVVTAYSNTMRTLLIAATVIAIIPPCLALLVDNIHLTDAHNAVEREDVGGERLDEKKLEHQ